MPVRVICISQTMGAGGEAVGRSAAEALRFRYVDEEIVLKAAEKQDLDPKLVADVETRKSILRRYLEELGESAGLDMYDAYGYFAFYGQALGEAPAPTSEGMRDLIRQVIRETADEGNVVIGSHAASIALAGRDDILRVLVTASPETRARRVADGPLDVKQAAKAVKESDAARANYFRRFYRIDRELPTHYDVVVNTDVLSTAAAADLLAHAARTRDG